jgi:hypothetical protein
MRRATYAACLLASPTLMEPVFLGIPIYAIFKITKLINFSGNPMSRKCHWRYLQLPK